VHVVGYQHTGVNDAIRLLADGLQRVEIEMIILFAEETRLEITAALYDMLRNTRQIETRLPCHRYLHVHQRHNGNNRDATVSQQPPILAGIVL